MPREVYLMSSEEDICILFVVEVSMKFKRLIPSIILQCVVFFLFLLYGIFVYKLFYWIGREYSIDYSNTVLIIYIIIGLLCISIPTVICHFRLNTGILFNILTLPIVFLLGLFIHPDGLYGFMPTQFFGSVSDVVVAIGITVQIAIVEIATEGVCSLICMLKKSKHR